jgi:hypothetical protein
MLTEVMEVLALAEGSAVVQAATRTRGRAAKGFDLQLPTSSPMPTENHL